jgi:ribose transport system permease protein
MEPRAAALASVRRPLGLLAAALGAWWLGVGPPDYFTATAFLTAAGGLALAAVGQTFVLLSGSQGLGGGAVIALVNVLVVTYVRDDPGSIALWVAAGPLLGAAAGLVNGALVGYLGLSSVAVTLATSFAVYGATLFFLDLTTPPAPASFMRLVLGDLVPGVVPATLGIVLLVLGVAVLTLRGRLGRAIAAVGRDLAAARASGIDVAFARMMAHVLAGAGYGAAGVFVSGVTGSADPLIGAPTVLQIYAAVAIGGVGLGGGRGTPFGAVLGALVVGTVVDLLFLAGIEAYWSTAVEGALLVVGLLLTRSIVPFVPAEGIRRALGRRLAGGAPAGAAAAPRVRPEPWRTALPATAALATVVALTFALDGDVAPLAYLGHLLASAVLLAVLAVGQGLVLSVRGLDVTLPATMALSAAVFATIAGGSDRLALAGVPATLAVAGAIGALNGALVALLGLRALFVTLAMTGALQALVIDATMVSTERYVSPAVVTVLTGSVAGVPILALVLAGFALAVVVVLDRGRLGTLARAVARTPESLSAGAVGLTLVAVHAAAGLLAGAAGILGSIEPAPARFGVGDTYLLPSVAAAVLGGIAVTGGRGRFAGAILGALLVTAARILLERLGLHYGAGHVAVGVLLIVGLVVEARVTRGR